MREESPCRACRPNTALLLAICILVSKKVPCPACINGAYVNNEATGLLSGLLSVVINLLVWPPCVKPVAVNAIFGLHMYLAKCIQYQH
jgi:hypothetical protein